MILASVAKAIQSDIHNKNYSDFLINNWILPKIEVDILKVLGDRENKKNKFSIWYSKTLDTSNVEYGHFLKNFNAVESVWKILVAHGYKVRESRFSDYVTLEIEWS